MRIITALAFTLLFAAIAATSLSWTTASAAPTAEQQKNCESQKKACLKAGSTTDSFGVRGVSPQVVKQCYEEYRACLGQK